VKLVDPESNPLYVIHEPSKEIYENSREQILDGTLEWLVKDRNITRALSSTTAKKQIVCLRGPPRSGKSCAASYLIDHVRQRNDRKSAVAYYFFSAANGMTSVRDALTAIVYQLQQFDFLQEERAVVSRNDSRYNPNFKPVPGMRRLIENGLGPYLTQSRVNVYLVIDGIDEANLRTTDPVARDTSEMKIFLRYLYDLKSARTRVILISRPLQMLDQCIPNLTYSNIDFEESCRAIDYYVGQFIKNNPDLQDMFHQAGIVPVEYFRVNGNGVFRWVQNALRQLSTVKRLPRFQRLITNLPEDYSLLFDDNARIFSNMDDEDKDEVKTIIYHLELSREPMMLMILRPMVEASLGPEVCRSPLKDESRDTFLNFLVQQCASFLRMDTFGGVIQADFVQFRHRSFQLFIHSDLGRDELDFDAQAIGTKEVLMALRKLTQYSKPPDELGGSCISWTDHLPMAETRGKKAAQILVAICRLFSSPTSIAVAIEWLTKLASSQEVDKLSPSTILMNSNPAVEKAITNIADWMRACRMDSTLIDQSELAKINKIKTLLSDDCLVAKAFGKWAMWVALWKPLRSIIDVKVMFGVAFNYYFRQSGHTNPGNVLRELIDGDFNGMVQWYDWHKPPEVENLGYVFSLLQQWERAIACYNTALQDSEDYALNVNLAEAYAKQGDHLNAVAQYKAAIANDFSFHHGCAYVAEIYRNRDDLKGFKQFAQDIGLDDHDELSFDDDTRISSMGVYMAAGDYHSAIRAFRDFDEIKILLNAYEKASYSDVSIIDSLERVLKVDPSRYVNLLYHFSNACQVHGYNDKAIEALRNGIQKRPRSRSDYVQLRLYLADVYMKSGRPDDAIDVLQEILNKYPDTVTAWTNLFDLLLSIRRLDDVIHGAERLCNTEEIKHSPAWFSCFYAGCAAKGRALEQKGDVRATILTHEQALSSNPMFWKLWGYLCEVYVDKDTATGVAISRELLERLEDDRKGNARRKRRHQFGCDYLEDESGAKAERFALWYGLFHVLQVVWREEHCTMSDPDGWTALHIAAYGGYKDIVSFILSRGQCDTALADRKGRTPLHIAAMEGHFEVVSHLLDFGFDVGAKDVLGFTALNLAIEADERDVEKILTRF
jgi:tetratricopeptide (TPR) repeat protein